MTADHVKQSRIAIPLPDVLEKYGEDVSAIYQELIFLNKENQTLGQLRDGLLPLLMNGQTEVSEWLNQNNGHVETQEATMDWQTVESILDDFKTHAERVGLAGPNGADREPGLWTEKKEK